MTPQYWHLVKLALYAAGSGLAWCGVCFLVSYCIVKVVVRKELDKDED